MTFEDKVAAMSATIKAEAANLGLIFVNGAGPEGITAPAANAGRTNGQARGVYLFAVAEG